MCGFDKLIFTGKNYLEDKYYNFYTTNDIITACNGGECKSRGLLEVTGWYQDYANMVYSEWPWLVRSGQVSDKNEAGVFTYHYGAHASIHFSFRLILIEI